MKLLPFPKRPEMKRKAPPPSAVSSRSLTKVCVSFFLPTAMYSSPLRGTTPEEIAFISVFSVLLGTFATITSSF